MERLLLALGTGIDRYRSGVGLLLSLNPEKTSRAAATLRAVGRAEGSCSQHSVMILQIFEENLRLHSERAGRLRLYIAIIA